jgi:hypothetical protein
LQKCQCKQGDPIGNHVSFQDTCCLLGMHCVNSTVCDFMCRRS